MDYSLASARSGLTGSAVLDIRRLHDLKTGALNDAQLSRKFGISRKMVYNIVERKAWKDVQTPVTVRGYKGYTLYPDGRVYSNISETFISPISRTSGPVVRIKASNGTRKTVPVSTLLAKGYGK